MICFLNLKYPTNGTTLASGTLLRKTRVFVIVQKDDFYGVFRSKVPERCTFERYYDDIDSGTKPAPLNQYRKH